MCLAWKGKQGKMSHILVILQENMEIAIFAEHRMRSNPLQEDLMWRDSLLEDSEVFTARKQQTEILFVLLQHTNNCCKLISRKYSTADFWNSQLAIVKLVLTSLARKFSSLKAGKAVQLPSSRISKTPFKTVTLRISYHQTSCSPMRLL